MQFGTSNDLVSLPAITSSHQSSLTHHPNFDASMYLLH